MEKYNKIDENTLEVIKSREEKVIYKKDDLEQQLAFIQDILSKFK